ncbi:MAG: SRPBCC domain-containing protein [Solirubrobacterales bacterium]|nr:SRPBCC domain-containing protein [Solirubrobacterales bacterium]
MTDRIERQLMLPASPPEVWEEITDPDRLSEWLADEAVLDLWPGGDAWFRIGDAIRTGWVEEVSPPGADGECGQLAFWWAEGDEPTSRVEIVLAPSRAGGTELRLVEARPLEVLDLVGIPLPGQGRTRYGPALVAAA